MADTKHVADKNPSTIGAVVMGAALGAAAVYLSSDKNRQAIKSHAGDLRQKGEELVEKAKEKANEVTTQGKKMATKGLKRAERNLESDSTVQTM